MKILIRSLIVCFVLISTSSCVTKYLWGSRNYEDQVNQFLIGEDGRYLVMIGTSYHYVFTDETRVLSRIVSLKQKGLLTFNPKKTRLKLEKDNEINGYITIDGPFNFLPIEDIGTLSTLGFQPDANGDISIRIDLQGRRYASRYLGQALTQSNNTIYLEIEYDRNSTAAANIGKAAITPIAVGVDAVLLIGKVMVYPFSM